VTGHEKYHRQLTEELYRLFGTHQLCELEFLENVFQTVESHIDGYIKDKN